MAHEVPRFPPDTEKPPGKGVELLLVPGKGMDLSVFQYLKMVLYTPQENVIFLQLSRHLPGKDMFLGQEIQ